MSGTHQQLAAKQQAAQAAVDQVADGMVLGLGTGSTAKLMIDSLGERVRGGLRILGIPTSERTAMQAKALGIPLDDFSRHTTLDLTIDGADEVHTDTLDLIKGLGGALLREKIVASASRRMTVIVDGSKLVPRLGVSVRLPVEIVRFGWQATAEKLAQIGAHTRPRQAKDGSQFLTDSGNLILDCAFKSIDDPALLAARLKAMTGVVETGLFVGLATTVIAGTASGVRVLERP